MKYIAEEFMKERVNVLFEYSQERIQSLNHYIENTMALAEADNWTQQDLFTEIITCGWDDLVEREYVLSQFIYDDHLNNRVRKLNK
jgi:hypothetical protein